MSEMDLIGTRAVATSRFKVTVTQTARVGPDLALGEVIAVENQFGEENDVICDLRTIVEGCVDSMFTSEFDFQRTSCLRCDRSHLT
jgi:hypothetical protein